MEKPKVWVIGLGRTGTTSMCEALKILGYKNVIHNPVFEQLSCADAAADHGCVVFYKYLDKKYPGSKFILLDRDIDSWLKSIEYIFNQYPAKDDTSIMRRMAIYETVAFDKEKMKSAYERYCSDVRRYFKSRPDDFLEMNIFGGGDAWNKLCFFLKLSIPNVPFPHLNEKIDKEKSCSFVFVCQKGELELMSSFLAASLRDNFESDTELTAVIPEIRGIDTFPANTTVKFLNELGVKIKFVANPLITKENFNRLGELLSNKIFALNIGSNALKTIFLDSDIVCLKKPILNDEFFDSSLCAKPVDLTNEKQWEKIYALFGLDLPSKKVACTFSGEIIPPYFNSGVLFVDSKHLRTLSETWEFCFKKIRDSRVMENNLFFREQVSFAVAVNMLSIDYKILSEQYNYPAHIRKIEPEKIPYFAHYHRQDVIKNDKILLDYFKYIENKYPLLKKVMQSDNIWASL